jgi:hypothetical protein
LNTGTKTEPTASEQKPFEATFSMINVMRPDYFQVVYACILITLLAPFRAGQAILVYLAALGGVLAGFVLCCTLLVDMIELIKRMARDLMSLCRRFAKSRTPRADAASTEVAKGSNRQ